jgi:hypothetical protein
MDECGTTETHQQLLGYLQRMSQLVSWIKIVITSRPDQDIKHYFDQSDPVGFATRDVYHYDASNDIQAFIHHRIANSTKAKLLPESTTEHLTKGAGGLFIWAQAACQFILNGHRPRTRLDMLLEGSESAQSSDALDKLYTTTIQASLGDNGDDNVRLMQQCLGAIILCSTRTPLSVSTLSELLGMGMESDVLQSVVDSLGSVLYTDRSQGAAVRVYHPSFADYLSNPSRSGRFCVDIDRQNAELAEGCLHAMMKGLRFNICSLETSYRRNRDIPDLRTRVEAAISWPLQYSCLYWTSHLVKIEKQKCNTRLIESMLRDLLIGPKVLFWIEVLSLVGRLETAPPSIRDLRSWCQVSNDCSAHY